MSKSKEELRKGRPVGIGVGVGSEDSGSDKEFGAGGDAQEGVGLRMKAIQKSMLASKESYHSKPT